MGGSTKSMDSDPHWASVTKFGRKTGAFFGHFSSFLAILKYSDIVLPSWNGPFLILVIKSYTSIVSGRIPDKILAREGPHNAICEYALSNLNPVFINLSMVVGIIPVVGMPLPFISKGGSSLLSFYIAFGIIISMATHKKLMRRWKI